MHILSEKQLAAAALLATGMTHEDTGKKLGVTRVTVSRWCARDEFKAEVERRKQVAIQAHQEQADSIIREEVEQFYEDVKKYRQSLINAYKARISSGVQGLQKTDRRFKDLPDEAIAPSNLAGLFQTFNNMIDSGFEGWAEMLALDKLMKKMAEDNEDGEQTRS